jgi:uncharacterized protein YcfJ
MNKSMIIGAIAGAAIVTAGGAFAGYKTWQGQHSAHVVNAELVTKQIKKPRQECHEEQVTHQQQPKDEHRVAGTLIGAVVGGVVGNQFGGGDGKKIATVVGAGAGGYAGNQVQERMQKGNTYTANEQRCSTVYDVEERPAGYKVTYEFAGKTHTTHMDHDPGNSLPVEDGQVVLNK